MGGFASSQSGQGIIGGIINAAGAIAGAGIQGGTAASKQTRANDMQRQMDVMMYNRQKKDALKNWNLQNQYNSPEAQMQRLKQAGLNPNLIYGSGTQGQISQQELKTPPANLGNYTKTADTPNIPLGGMMSDIYDLKVKDAQANLLNEQAKTQSTQRELNALESELKRLEAIKLDTSNKFDKTTLDKRIETITAQYDSLLVNMANTRSQTRTEAFKQDNIQANTKATRDSNKRENQKQPYNIAELKSKISNLNANTSGTIASTLLTKEKTTTEKIIQQINDWEVKLNQRGTTKNDGLLRRTIAKIWTLVKGGDLDQAYNLIENNK